MAKIEREAYDAAQIEEKWQATWDENGINTFTRTELVPSDRQDADIHVRMLGQCGRTGFAPRDPRRDFLGSAAEGVDGDEVVAPRQRG